MTGWPLALLLLDLYKPRGLAPRRGQIEVWVDEG
jgi:hypothetical protein